jgi:flagellar hook protein FlgE
MIRSLSSAVSGLQSFQNQIDVIGNNISNVNTTAYKAARTEFSDAFSQTLRGSAPASASGSGLTAIQVGSGVSTASIHNIDTQGALSRSGVTSDMAIAGEGYFLVKDALSGTTYATRDGTFHLDANSYLVTSDGLRVQGNNISGGVSTVGDIKIDADGKTNAAGVPLGVQGWTVDTSGDINVALSDGMSNFTRGSILLQNYANPQALMKSGNNLYAGLANANPVSAPARAGTAGLGTVVSGALELSNVDLAKEFSDLIIAQRSFQATSKMITTSDEVLQELVNLKR